MSIVNTRVFRLNLLVFGILTVLLGVLTLAESSPLGLVVVWMLMAVIWTKLTLTKGIGKRGRN